MEALQLWGGRFPRCKYYYTYENKRILAVWTQGISQSHCKNKTHTRDFLTWVTVTQSVLVTPNKHSFVNEERERLTEISWKQKPQQSDCLCSRENQQRTGQEANLNRVPWGVWNWRDFVAWSWAFFFSPLGQWLGHFHPRGWKWQL